MLNADMEKGEEIIRVLYTIIIIIIIIIFLFFLNVIRN